MKNQFFQITLKREIYSPQSTYKLKIKAVHVPEEMQLIILKT